MTKFQTFCKYVTYVFIGAATMFTWVELIVMNHWVFASLIIAAVFVTLGIKEVDNDKTL